MVYSTSLVTCACQIRNWWTSKCTCPTLAGKIKVFLYQSYKATLFVRQLGSKRVRHGYLLCKQVFKYLFLVCGSFPVNQLCDIFQRKTSERRLGLRDLQNLYFSPLYPSPLLNSSHFLTLISEFAAMIKVPRGIASDADRLQLANKALWFSVLLGASRFPFGCRNRNLNLLLIVAAQRPAHATGMQAENQWSYPKL